MLHVLGDDHGDDVGTAGRGAGLEDDAQSETDEDGAEQHQDHCCGGVANERLITVEVLQNGDEGRQCQHTRHRLRTELGSEPQRADEQQRQIQAQSRQTDREVEQVVQNDGDTVNATGRQLQRRDEYHVAHCHNRRAQKDHTIISDELLDFCFIHNLLFFLILYYFHQKKAFFQMPFFVMGKGKAYFTIS